jgi:CubicO group peptidase (beta-lactamase class C family)
MLSLVLASLARAESLSGPLANTAQCKNLEKLIHTHSGQKHTSGILVTQNRLPVFEWYDGVTNQNTLHLLWSGSKSITATLVAVAIQDGKLKLDDRLSDFFPESIRLDLKDPNESNYSLITIRHLLQMSSSFDWQELDAYNPQELTVTHMIYGEGSRDMLRFALRRPLLPQAPGTLWNYSSGNSVILMGILKKVYGADGDQMPWKRLFHRIGADRALIEQDAADNFSGGAHILMSLRSLNQVAQLYLNDGKYKDDQVLPKDWVEQAMTQAPAMVNRYTPDQSLTHGGYGFSFWLNKGIPERNVKPIYPHAPSDMILLQGLYGQYLVIFPTQKIVIARSGYDDLDVDSLPELLNEVMSCVLEQPEADVSKDGDKQTANLNFWESLQAVRFLSHSGMLTRGFALEMCNCSIVGEMGLKECRQRFTLGGAGVFIDVDKRKDEQGQVIGMTALSNPLAELVDIGEGQVKAKSRIYDQSGMKSCRLVD